jgi:hypothetical protein
MNFLQLYRQAWWNILHTIFIIFFQKARILRIDSLDNIPNENKNFLNSSYIISNLLDYANSNSATKAFWSACLYLKSMVRLKKIITNCSIMRGYYSSW